MRNESNLRDMELLKLIKKGDTKALEEIIQKYEARTFNLAIKFMHNEEDAEEVVQDVFLTLFHKAKSFKGKSAFSSWLYRVVVNCAFMKLRKKKQEQAVSIEDISPNAKHDWVEKDTSFFANTDSKLITSQLYDNLNSAIQKLPQRYKSVFVLRDVNGLSNQEVGELLSISLPAVKSRLHRARIMLQKRLYDCYVDYTGTTPKTEMVDL